jgi:hypothetical protein
MQRRMREREGAAAETQPWKLKLAHDELTRSSSHPMIRMWSGEAGPADLHYVHYQLSLP